MNYLPNTATKPGDAEAGIEISEDFERFSQRNDIFNRAFWDDTVRSPATEAFFSSLRVQSTARKGDGFTRRDFALRDASWIIANQLAARYAAEGRREGFQAEIGPSNDIAEDRLEIDDPAEMSLEIKHISRFFGADLCGITKRDERWHYTARVDNRDFTETPNSGVDGLENVIVLGHGMDEGLVATYPSALAGASTGREYSREVGIVTQIAAYIRNLGYNAVASMNDTALAIPYAVQAGLGEYGRNQMLISPEFGPRLRISKIFTDMPLAYDSPKRPGVAKFCDICTKCADACPVKALPLGPPEFGGPNRSAISGIRKWTSDAEKCFGFWAKLAGDCAICMRVCPFNRDFSKFWHRLWLRLALSPFRKLALRLDRGRGGRLKPSQWWESFRKAH